MLDLMKVLVNLLVFVKHIETASLPLQLPT